MNILDKLFESEMMKNKSKFMMPCPRCGINDSVVCEYCETDYWGEFDCYPPEDIDEDCSYCKYAWCSDCRKEEKIFSILSKEDFKI